MHPISASTRAVCSRLRPHSGPRKRGIRGIFRGGRGRMVQVYDTLRRFADAKLQDGSSPPGMERSTMLLMGKSTISTGPF